ncbi:MAG: FMN-binding protein [Mycobacteriales bacterium]
MTRRPIIAISLTVAALVALLRYQIPREPLFGLAPLRPHVSATPAPARAPSRRAARVVHAALAASQLRATSHAAAAPPTSPGPASTAVAALPTRSASAPPSRGSSPTPTKSSTPRPAGTTKTFTGLTEQTPYGPVQVQITTQGKQITDVEALQMPADTYHSQQLSSYAGPQLRQQVLAAQSANIQGVSGATYTSNGYRQSVQSAIDQWNV